MAAGDRDAAADALLEIIAPRPRMERGRGAQAGCSNCSKPPASRTRGPRRSAAGCRRCCSHDASAKPARVPIFPLAGAILFPRAQLPLHIFEPRYRAMVRDALAGQGRIAHDPAAARRR